MAWIKCVAKPGIFDNEYLIGVDTIDGRRHLFVYSGCIRETDGIFELSVGVATELVFQSNEDCTRIILPAHPFEGGTMVLVRSSSLAHD